MKCSNCGSSIDDDSVFCSSCGKAVAGSAGGYTGVNSSASSHSSNNLSDYDGKRRREDKKGAIKYFYGKAKYMNAVAHEVNDFLAAQNMETQIIDNGKEIIVQGKNASKIKTVFGLNKAATVAITTEGDDLLMKTGDAQWIDKGAGLVIGFLFFAPTFFTAIYGAFKQVRLFSEIDNHIEEFLSSKQ